MILLNSVVISACAILSGSLMFLLLIFAFLVFRALQLQFVTFTLDAIFNSAKSTYKLSFQVKNITYISLFVNNIYYFNTSSTLCMLFSDLDFQITKTVFLVSLFYIIAVIPIITNDILICYLEDKNHPLLKTMSPIVYAIYILPFSTNFLFYSVANRQYRNAIVHFSTLIKDSFMYW